MCELPQHSQTANSKNSWIWKTKKFIVWKRVSVGTRKFCWGNVWFMYSLLNPLAVAYCSLVLPLFAVIFKPRKLVEASNNFISCHRLCGNCTIFLLKLNYWTVTWLWFIATKYRYKRASVYSSSVNYCFQAIKYNFIRIRKFIIIKVKYLSRKLFIELLPCQLNQIYFHQPNEIFL